MIFSLIQWFKTFQSCIWLGLLRDSFEPMTLYIYSGGKHSMFIINITSHTFKKVLFAGYEQVTIPGRHQGGTNQYFSVRRCVVKIDLVTGEESRAFTVFHNVVTVLVSGAFSFTIADLKGVPFSWSTRETRKCASRFVTWATISGTFADVDHFLLLKISVKRALTHSIVSGINGRGTLDKDLPGSTGKIEPN